MGFSMDGICLSCASLMADGTCYSKHLKRIDHPVKKCNLYYRAYMMTLHLDSPVPNIESEHGDEKK